LTVNLTVNPVVTLLIDKLALRIKRSMKLH